MSERSRPSRYFTDGTHLFRLVDGLDRARRGVVCLEDCASLELVLLPVAELLKRSLRPVWPPRQSL